MNEKYRRMRYRVQKMLHLIGGHESWYVIDPYGNQESYETEQQAVERAKELNENWESGNV